jgi:hypothetical protein
MIFGSASAFGTGQFIFAVSACFFKFSLLLFGIRNVLHIASILFMGDWSRFKYHPYHFGDRIFGDPKFLAIIGFKPIGKLLGAFAGIAREAASGNVFAAYNSCVINDVFPCRHRFF